MPIRTAEVFKTQGKPNYTYVSVTDGKYERSLAGSIENAGTLCLVTGPSKTGKTTLVSAVCDRLGLVKIVVRCDDQINSEEFWRKALEKVDFERLISSAKGKKTGTENSGSIEGVIGWKWLAGISGRFTSKFITESSEELIKEKILSKPSTDHLIPLLKKTNALLVVEDFHYLSESVQKTVFQQWKSFVDEEVSVVVLGTNHHACDLAYANNDLTGRIAKVDLTTWLESDLKEIVQKGCEALNLILEKSVIRKIVKESVGLPIMTQAICFEILYSKGVEERCMDQDVVAVSNRELLNFLHNVAISKFSQFEVMYNRIIAGLRNGARKYKTYECMLTAFSEDPMKFSLKRLELKDRISKIPMPDDLKPPEGSIAHSLGRIRQLQSRIGVELLEWVKRDDTLYIVEPTFLYYLRWRKMRHESPDIYSLLQQFMTINIEITNSRGGKVIKFKNTKAEKGH